MVKLSSLRQVVLSGAVYVATYGVHAAPSPYELSRRIDAIAGLTGLGVSEGCQSTLSSLMSTPASTCLNLPGTLAVVTTVANSSWIPPLNTWLSNFCSAETCTDDQLSSTVGTAADGCSNELAMLGVTKDFVVQQAVTYYPVAKEAVCLRDQGNSNDLCAITTLENLQTALGGDPLTPTVLINKYDLLLANDYALARQLACTPCASAAFALVRPALPQEFLDMIDSFVGDQCGVDFTSTPTGDIAVVTGTQAVLAAQATASSTSSATTINVRSAFMGTAGVGIAGLVALLL